MLIRPETAGDLPAIRQVNRLAFGQEAEGRLIDELREQGHVRLSLVAEDDGRIIGHILFSDIRPLACRYAGAALMALELIPGALHGISGELESPPPFQSFWRRP